jgi:phosphatidylserine/phosphatidylglycerophosphate/cardiolipin synthase-like enzyme
MTDLLERRLWGPTPFDLDIGVDKHNFEERSLVHQRPRLLRLHEGGAKVHLIRGTPPHGAMHVKAVVVDRRRLYMGSPNLTYKSTFNVELVVRVTGPPVTEVLSFLSDMKSQGRVWDGS